MTDPETTYRELFTLLERDGWLDADLARRLRDMAGFRNILVHGYAAPDLDVVESVLAERLDDLLDFSRSIRAGLAT